LIASQLRKSCCCPCKRKFLNTVMKGLDDAEKLLTSEV
jgi:hypothetical protein